jgi:hypothetical protein
MKISEWIASPALQFNVRETNASLVEWVHFVLKVQHFHKVRIHAVNTGHHELAGACCIDTS